MAHAQSSPNYSIVTDVISGGGEAASSAHYEDFDCAIGQASTIGRSSSTGYINQAGFMYVIPEVEPFDNIYVSSNGVCGGKKPCFAVLQSAINWAQTLTIINVTQDTYNENIVFNSPKYFTLRGGCDPTFTSCVDSTGIQGSLTIGDGTLIVENIILR